MPDERRLSPGARKRREYFNRGAAAYERLLGIAGVYLCPLCGSDFSADALEGDQLTLEDVPPRSIGGSPMCLTCRRCNSTAGHVVDRAVAELARMGALHDARAGRGRPFEARARLDMPRGGHLNARLSYDENGVRRVTAYRAENNPRTLESVAAAGRIMAQLSVPFRASEREAFVSFLRAGYLAAFSFGGYSFALDCRLDGVRRQIASPTADIIPMSALAIVPRDAVPPNAPFVGKAVSPILSTAVCLTIAPRAYRGAMMVLLPPLTEAVDFYEKLATLYPLGHGRRETEFVAWGWPSSPEHNWDYPLDDSATA